MGWFRRNREETTSPEIPEEVREGLAAAGISFDPGSQVQVVTSAREASAGDMQAVLDQLRAVGITIDPSVFSAAQVQVQGPSEVTVVDTRGHEELQGAGTPGRATIEAFEVQPLEIGDQRIVKLDLNVTAEGREPYRVETAATLGDDVAARLVEGMSVPVKIDPNDPSRLAGDWSQI